ncbi:MAG: hypothetical protein PVF43_09005 [Candidatus Eiseniibacteriota bacterium]|jgi:hypothetical protein
MTAKIFGMEYFRATIRDTPGATYQLLHKLAEEKVNMLAFRAIPMGPEVAQVEIFPEVPQNLIRAARSHDFELSGPFSAFLIRGDDQLGALTEIHRKLYDSDINVYTASGVTDGRGGFGYIVYVRPEDYLRAAQVLGV